MAITRSQWSNICSILKACLLFHLLATCHCAGETTTSEDTTVADTTITTVVAETTVTTTVAEPTTTTTIPTTTPALTTTTSNATTTGVNGTTETPMITCHQCNATACAVDYTAGNSTCTQAGSHCWTLFYLETGTVLRGCSAGSFGTTCPQEYPGGQYTNQVCGYCCSGGLCNNKTMTAAECQNLQAKNGVATPIPQSVSFLGLLSLVFAIVLH